MCKKDFIFLCQQSALYMSGHYPRGKPCERHITHFPSFCYYHQVKKLLKLVENRRSSIVEMDADQSDTDKYLNTSSGKASVEIGVFLKRDH